MGAYIELANGNANHAADEGGRLCDPGVDRVIQRTAGRGSKREWGGQGNDHAQGQTVGGRGAGRGGKAHARRDLAGGQR